jgi:hypothetical protein
MSENEKHEQTRPEWIKSIAESMGKELAELLEREKAYRTQERQSEAALRVAREALDSAVDTIRTWHDMAERGVGNEGSEAWKIYYEHAPEMKPIRQAITKINSILDGGE